MKELYLITKEKTIAYIDITNNKNLDIEVKLFKKIFKEVCIFTKSNDFILNFENNINKFDLIIINEGNSEELNNLILFVKELKIEQKIIMCSAYNDVNFVNNILSLGVNGYLNKPMVLEELNYQQL